MNAKLKTGLVFLLALLWAACAAGTSEEASAVRFLIGGTETILPWEDQETDCAYVFLPSWAEMGSLQIQFPEDHDVQIGEEPLISGSDCASFETDRMYSLSANGIRSGHMMFLKTDHVAALFLTTGDGAMDAVHADKNHGEKVRAALYTADGELNYQSASGDEIKGRGHSTWHLEKKPYNLKLKRAASLLGMTPARKWSLLANGFDESSLRTKTVLDAARSIAPYDGFAPECAYVDVYLNGLYNGLYLMCRSRKDTASLFLNGTEPDGFEIELTTDYKTDDGNETVEISMTSMVQIHEPSPTTDEQYETLESLLGGLEVWMFSRSSGSSNSPVDLESWARKILVEAVFDNYDGTKSSQFFWGSLKDRILFAGPCWDYDLTMGVYYGIPWSTAHAFMAFNDWNEGEDLSWYHGLWEKPEIRDLALSIYQGEFREVLQSLPDRKIPEEAAAIAASAEMDRIRWPGLRSRYGSFSEAVQAVTDFLRERLVFLDDIWLARSEYHRITMKLPEGVILNEYVPAGEVWKNVPEPWQVMMEKIGEDSGAEWYRQDTDEPFDGSAPITEDMTLYVKER